MVRPAAMDAPTIHANAAPAFVYHSVENNGILGASSDIANDDPSVFIIIVVVIIGYI